MLALSPSGVGLVIHSTHWYIVWFVHHSPTTFIHYSSKSHSKLIAALLEFIPMSDNASSTVTPTAVTTDTYIYGSQAP